MDKSSFVSATVVVFIVFVCRFLSAIVLNAVQTVFADVKKTFAAKLAPGFHNAFVAYWLPYETKRVLNQLVKCLASQQTSTPFSRLLL